MIRLENFDFYLNVIYDRERSLPITGKLLDGLSFFSLGGSF